MKIRNAIPADAKSIAKVHVDSWKSTYQNIIPNEFLENLSYEQREKLWNQNLSKVGDYVVVAENDVGEIIGFADCGKRDRNQIQNSGDITSIYLLEEYQGRGIGRKMMKKLFLQFQKWGYNRVFVEVLEDNKTRYFYEYYGAELIKSDKITISGAKLNLLIYEWIDINKALAKLNLD